MRHELKYNPECLRFEDCLEIIRHHPASFVKTYEDRQVNNIYFDTPSMDAYSENVAGIANRRKYRIRWYGDDWQEISKPILETKIKENQMGTKASVPFESFVMNELTDVVFSLKQKNHLPAQLSPVSTNHYLRSYFESMDHKYRITIDRHLRYGSFLYGARIPVIGAYTIIIELKYDAEDHLACDWVRQYLPFRRTRFSKYVDGLLKTAV